MAQVCVYPPYLVPKVDLGNEISLIYLKRHDKTKIKTRTRI